MDLYGIVFKVADGDLVNLCYGAGCASEPSLYAALQWDGNTVTFHDVTRSSFGQPVPEPSTIIFLGTGLAGLGGVLRRKLF